jgi:Do/DeqQ family serine protease
VIKRFLFSILLLGVGLATGIAVSGRAVQREEAAQPRTDAESAAPASPSEPASTIEGAQTTLAAGPDFTRVAAQTVRAVTNISAIQLARRQASPFANDPFFQYFFGGDPGELFGYGDRYASSLGSGVIVSADGYVITNNHVVGQNVANVTVSIGDRRELRAKIVGLDSWTDLALLKVDATGLPVIPWGDSSRLRVAEWVMAIGNPFSLNQTVTLGVVSALGRAGVGISMYEDFIQTDAAINPGNSGGALISSRGELVGINTAIFSQSGGYQGIGFAVPSNLARRVVDDLMKYGEVRRGSIGLVEVSAMTTRLAEELRAPDTEGVVITQMSRASGAYQAGLRPGDIIKSVEGREIANPAQFVRAIADSAIGATVRIDFLRDGRSSTVRVEVERQQPRGQRRGR